MGNISREIKTKNESKEMQKFKNNENEEFL